MNQDIQQLSRQLKGQYILTAEGQTAPEGWSIHEHDKWKLFTSGLPLTNVFNEKDTWLGWCLGYPIVDGRLLPEKITLAQPTRNAADAVEDFYWRTTGRWALVLFNEKKLYLDPYGSLATVYSTAEKTVASTPTLIGSEEDWDKEFMDETDFPEKLRWLPSGLTFKKNISRLLPNHCLDLATWKNTRHWPTPQTDLSINTDIPSAVKKIVANANGTLEALAKENPLCFTLTGGRDSRMLFAVSRKQVQASPVFTYTWGKENLDTFIARSLSEKLRLNHKFITIDAASESEMEQWLKVTGYTVSGDILKIHKTFQKLDPSRVLLPGTAAEIHKGNYWRAKDDKKEKISAREVLVRCKMPDPDNARMLEATEAWLRELDFLDIFQVLDLLHIEQRLGCWAASQPYGNPVSKFELSVFNSRPIFQTMMRLPRDYRRKKQLVVDVCKSEWPGLLLLPFNEYTGVRGFLRSRVKKLKSMLKDIVQQ